jgi:hypothetical protein
VPALDAHPGADSLAGSVPEGMALVAEREPVDVDELGVVHDPVDDSS